MFLSFSLARSFVVNNRTHFKPLVDFLVNSSLSKSCAGRAGCKELRPLPKPFQNKKIVFNKDTDVQFESFNDGSYVDNSELDTLGFLDAEPGNDNLSFINPIVEARGSLKEREYKIIRAVYEYNCTLCIDSSDISYFVLEDSNGNRFITLLDDIDFSVEPGRDLLWDEYAPYFMNGNKNNNEPSLAKLEDI